MKPSGAPDVGDLVQATGLRGLHLTLGIVLECRGIECLVMWAGPMEGNWWPRNQLKVISETR